MINEIGRESTVGIGFVETVRLSFKRGVMSEGVMDSDSGESMDEDLITIATHLPAISYTSLYVRLQINLYRANPVSRLSTDTENNEFLSTVVKPR